MFHLQSLSIRINTIIAFFFAALALISMRLFYLQIYHGTHYASQGEKNFLRIETTQSPRGNIIDRTGKLLATNRPITQLDWHGSGNKTISVQQREKIQALEEILGITIEQDPALSAAIARAEKRYTSCLITKQVSMDQLCKIKERYPEDQNIGTSTRFERYYPYKDYACHIVGYLGKQANMPAYGQTGLEKMCNDILKGHDGTISKIINSVGRNITTQAVQQATIGNDIHVTLDLDLQRAIERIFPADRAGAFIVMDPEQGDILATVSRPAFDPSLFLESISYQKWHDLQKNNPFLNRSISSYPPGSFFKLITIATALENNILDPNQLWHCKGFVNFANRNYWCHHRWGHGDLNTIQALAQSCNVLFYELGKLIDIDLLAHYASEFGLGKPTGFLFHEQIGLVPSRAWKQEIKGEAWWPGETLSVAIGQSYLLATPLQIARMIGSIFTGYLVKPRILQHEPIEITPLEVKKRTLNFLKHSMQLVVQSGTGKRVAMKDMKIYAKTSTAQIADFNKRNLSPNYLEHAWFAAHVQYKNHKPLVVVILIEHAGSSKTATLLARQFLLEYKQLALRS